MNKSLITTLILILITFSALFLPVLSAEIFLAGLFGLSGAITNWVAVHMLFEKVPFLYGSGVIVVRFNDLKSGIKSLIIEEFFNEASIQNFLNDKEKYKNNFLDKIDYDKIFFKFVESVEESSLGSMLKMVGGKEALEPLKNPLTEKMRQIFKELIEEHFNNENDLKEVFKNKINSLIDKRLNELSPNDIKTIIKNIIHKHLGWLVIWGGVFGFILGLILSVLGGIN